MPRITLPGKRDRTSLPYDPVDVHGFLKIDLHSVTRDRYLEGDVDRSCDATGPELGSDLDRIVGNIPPVALRIQAPAQTIRPGEGR